MTKRPETKRCPSCGWTMRLSADGLAYECTNRACELEEPARVDK